MTLTWAGREIEFKPYNAGVHPGNMHYASAGELELRVWRGTQGDRCYADGAFWAWAWDLDVKPGDSLQQALDALHAHATKQHEQLGRALQTP